MRPKLTYANVVASLALFVALGGTSYAVTTLGKNSVKSENIGKEQVKGSDIAKNERDYEPQGQGLLASRQRL